MKNFFTLSFVMLLALLFVLPTKSQAQSTLPKVWLDTAGTYIGGVAAGPQWFKRATNGDRVRGMAYNPATGNVLVATRDSAFNCIMIISGTNGDTLGRLDMTGVSTGTGTFPFNRVAVSSDGRIYTMNLQTAVTKAAPVKIYTWANEGAVPTVAFSDSLRGPRIGDALTVVGSGQETYVYVAGNAAPGVINVLKRSGDTLVFYKEIVPTGWASGVLGIGVMSNTFDAMWINTAGKPAIKYDTTGAPLDTVGTGIVSSGASTARYFELGGRKFLAMFAGNVTPSVVRVVDITSGGLSSYVVGVTAPLGNYANSNGTGEVYFNPADTTLIALGTNNGVGKFSINLATPGVTYNDRFPYVPMAGEPDTVYFNLLSMKPLATAEMKYYGYRSASSDQDGVDSGAVTLTQVSGRVYNAIVPGSVNRNGRRVNFTATVKDNANMSFTSAVIPGYFAGTTKMAYKNGPRDIDTLGAILWANYGIRIEGICIQEDSITQRINLDVNIQDDMGAMTVFNPLANGGIKFDVVRGNRYSVVARLQAFNGKIQIREERTGHPTPAFTDLGPGMPIIPRLVTVKELNDNGELYENSLVAVKNINFTATSPLWPAAGATGSALNLRVTDNGTDTVTMRLAEFGGLSGMNIPGPWSHVVGVAGQFDASSPRVWDYQFIPRDSNDFKYTPAQLELPLHFENPMVTYDFLNFSGATTTRVANPFKTGMDTSGFVAKTVKGVGDPWAGSFLTLGAPIDLTKGKIFKAKVYMPKVGAKMLFKLEHLTVGSINKEIDVVATKANEWEELTFDFSSVADTTKYQKVVVIFDLGTSGDGGPNFTYYFDDIRQMIAPPPPPPPAGPKPVFPLWAKTKAAGTLPSTFIPSGNYERGMAAGRVNGNDRVYVVSRSGGPKIISYDAKTGDSVGVLYQSANASGGTFPLNVVEVSDDGVIFAANMTTDAAGSNFKVYRWNTENDTPKVVIDYNGADLPASSRMGDMFSVFGKASDNTLAIYAAVSGQENIVKFTTTDNGKSFSKSIIQLSTGANGSMPNVAQLSDGTIYVKSYARKLSRYDDMGGLIDTISGSIVGSDVTNIKAIERAGKKFIVCYYPNDGTGTTDERFTVVNVTNPKSPVIEFASPSIGNVINGNATGAVDVMMADTNFVFFILGTNNGFAAFTPNPSLIVQSLDTLFYGDTPTIIKNPYGVGYVAGVNGYKDIGKYQRFDFKSQDLLGAFTAYFGVKQIVGTPDTLMMVVRTAKAAAPSGPDSLIASIPFTTDMMDTTVKGNTFILPYAIKAKGPLFIGVEWSAAGNDTFALFSDKNGEGNNAGRAWERFEDGSFNDFGTLLNPTFSWDLDVDLRIKAYYRKGLTTGVEEATAVIPDQYALDQNYPNPFNPSTTIRFALPAMSSVRLSVYDILGREIRTLMNGEMGAGYHQVVWDGKNNNGSQAATGMYIYRIESGSFVSAKKMLLLK